MNTIGLNPKGYFTKPQFFRLIDSNGKLGYATLQHYWEEYVISYHQDLDAFYRELDPSNPNSRYIQKSIHFHFKLEKNKVSEKEEPGREEEKHFPFKRWQKNSREDIEVIALYGACSFPGALLISYLQVFTLSRGYIGRGICR